MNIRQQIYGETGLQESPLVCVKNPKGAKAKLLHSVSVSRAESRNGDTRVQDRFRIVDESARVTHCAATYDVQLINICGSGAMVSADFEPVPWDRVALHLGDHEPIDSTVLWVRGGRIGLEFTQPISLDRADNERATPIREMIMSRFPDARFERAIEPQEPATQPNIEEQRLERRNPLIRMGTVHYDYQSTPARLRNISSAGATIETSAGLAQGAEPLLDLGEAGSVFGTVVWLNGERAGLRFNQPFDLSQLPKARAHPVPASWEPPAYLRNNAHCDSRWQDQNPGSLTELNEDLDGFLKR
jgi:PilZ domain-containing protein